MPKLVPHIPTNDWVALRRALNKLASTKLGPGGSPTFAGLTLTDLTASALIGTNASKLLESVTIGSSLDYTRPTLDTIQDIRTSASPTFAGLTVVNAINEFSTDGTMGGDSDSAVPTEKATKLYTDTLRADLASTNNAKGASLVGIEDSASLYTAANVETALAEVMDKVTPVTTTGNSITTPTGTVDAGDINSTTTIDDADSYDVSEVTGSPGFDIQITFTGIASGKEPNKVQLHISYDGSAGHTVDLEMWNYTGSPQWDVISADFLPNTGGVFFFYEIDIPGTVTDYVSGGEAKLRFNHTSSGNANHDVSIDFAALKHDLGSGAGVTEHGALSGLGDDDHTQYIKDAEFTQDSGILVGTGTGTFAEETGATLRTSLGLGTGDSPQFTGIELGHASDTTITRISAGVVAIEGTNIAMVGGAHHDGFSDFVANEHIDHTGVILTAGTGLTGGGDISANRTFAVDGILEDLDTLGVASSDGEFIVATGAGAFAYEATTVVRTSLGLGTGDSPQFTGVELGHATDTTITRASAGVIAIEGTNVMLVGDAPTAHTVASHSDTTGTGAELEELTDGSETTLHSHANGAATTMSFVHRGDPADYDYDKNDLTTDDAWHDLDLSSIVPANAKFVVLHVLIKAATTDKLIEFRKKGNTNLRVLSLTETQVANIWEYGEFFVACDDDRVVQYYVNDITWTDINIQIYGWFLED